VLPPALVGQQRCNPKVLRQILQGIPHTPLVVNGETFAILIAP
jgi:hypothetical protein